MCREQLERMKPHKKISKTGFELDEREPGFHLFDRGINWCIDVFLFSPSLPILLNFLFAFNFSFCLLGLSFASLIQISYGLSYMRNKQLY
jgi:hypothetical protein